MSFIVPHNTTISQFGQDVLKGFSRPQKEIPCRWLYDHDGSELFEKITGLPEYYPTRTEVGILKAHAQDIADIIGSDAVIVEYGAGAATKTRLLLDALSAPRAYIPIDISASFLNEIEQKLQADYPNIKIRGLARDFLDPTLKLELPPHSGRRVGFFPGSTIGNMSDHEIIRFFRSARLGLRPDSIFIVGLDLKKDPSILIPAYDDSAGVTAAFNLNLLKRINRELFGNFNLNQFRHEARWNASRNRIEMHLVSLVRQTAAVLGQLFRFEKGETIHTENSRKFDMAVFSRLLGCAGWKVHDFWSDSKHYFAVAMLVPAGVYPDTEMTADELNCLPLG